MEKQPISKFLKVMSIITLISGIIGLAAAITMPMVINWLKQLADQSGVDMPSYTGLMFVGSIVACLMDIIMSILALLHKKIEVVRIMAVLTIMIIAVFNSMSMTSVSEYISIIYSLLFPFLFYLACDRQVKIDNKL